MQCTDISFELEVGHSERGRLAEAKPTAPAARSKPAGFPGIPVRDARSAEWELMSPVSTARSVRGDRFQMHHYRYCAGDPLMSWRCEPLSFAYFSLRQAKKSRCRPAQGQR